MWMWMWVWVCICVHLCVCTCVPVWSCIVSRALRKSFQQQKKDDFEQEKQDAAERERFNMHIPLLPASEDDAAAARAQVCA